MPGHNRRVSINGRNLAPDFWEGPEEGAKVVEYRKTATVLALPLVYPALIHTPEGDMEAEPGDYLVSDNPPTHCWSVKREVFERTYVPAIPDPGLAVDSLVTGKDSNAG